MRKILFLIPFFIYNLCFASTAPSGVVYVEYGNSITGSSLVVVDNSSVAIGTGITGNNSKLYIKGTGSEFLLRIANTSGVDKLVIQPDGNLGIGLTNPSYKLDVAGTTSTDVLRVITSLLLPTNSITDTFVADNITLTNITQITTKSHTSLADIGTNTHAQIDTFIAGGTGPGDITSVGDALTGAVFAAGDTDSLLGKYIGIGKTNSTVYLNIYSGTGVLFPLKVADSGGNDRLVIQQGGNVGIGLTNPVSPLDILSAQNQLLHLETSDNTGEGFASIRLQAPTDGTGNSADIVFYNAGYGDIRDNALYFYNYHRGGNIVFAPKNISGSILDSVIILGNGNVGINHTNPLCTLHVAGTAAAKTLQFGNNLDNILPAGTGATNEILKLIAPGVIGWAADNAGGTADVDNITINTNPAAQLQIAAGTQPAGHTIISNGASGLSWADTFPDATVHIAAANPHSASVDSVTAIKPLNSSGGTRPSITLSIGAGLGTDASQNLYITTVPTVSLGIVPLSDTSHISGTLPLAYMSTIPLGGLQVSGTLPLSKMDTIPLGGVWVQGTLPANKVAVIPLSTGVSGTLPYTSMSTIPLNGSLLIGTLPATQVAVIPLATGVSGTLSSTNLGINWNLVAATGAANQVLTTTSGATTAWQTPSGGGSASFTNTTPGAVLAIQTGGGNTANGANLFIWDDTNKQVNLGTFTTGNSARLYIKGAATSTEMNLRVANSLAVDKFVILDNGNVGIGTTAPSMQLHIFSTSTAPTRMGIGTTASTTPLTILNSDTAPASNLFLKGATTAVAARLIISQVDGGCSSCGVDSVGTTWACIDVVCP